MYAVLHFGGHDFACGIRAWENATAYERMKDDLLQRYARYTLADMVRGMDQHFPDGTFSLTHLFIEQRRHVLARVTSALLERYEETYRRIWDESRKLVGYLHEAEAPIPAALAMVGRHVLEEAILAEVERMRDPEEPVAIPVRLFELSREASDLGLTLDLTAAKPAMAQAVGRALAVVEAELTAERVAEAVRLIESARQLGVRFGLWATQNRFFDIWRARPEARAILAPLGTSLGFNLTVEPH
jgi:hypothetical protein